MRDLYMFKYPVRSRNSLLKPILPLPLLAMLFFRLCASQLRRTQNELRPFT